MLRYILALIPNLAEAREILQSTAIELWRKFADYDPARPFTPWACRFALRQVQGHLRRTQRWRVMLDDTLVETPAEELEQLGEAMERRFAHLQGEVIRLYYHEQVPLPDISSRLGRSVDALYKVLQRARRQLLDGMSAAAAREEPA